MGLLNRLFRPGGGAAARDASDAEGEPDVERPHSAHAPRRELVHMVLRDTMRKHGIPSDWIDCRILSVVTRKRKPGMHVQFIVRQGDERMLAFVHPFQETFWRELEKFEARPREWLFSLAWQFEGDAGGEPHAGLASDGWDDDTQPPEDTRPPEQDTQPPQHEEDELASDLQALYAIRDAAISQPAELSAQPQAPASGGAAKKHG